MWAAIALTVFVELHLVDGSVVKVSPHSIVSMRGRGAGGHFVEGAECLLNLTDGKYLAVREKCEEVFALIEKSEEE